MKPSSDPAQVVQKQLDAYNAHDLDALIATYAEDAELFAHPATLLARGSVALRERFATRLREPNLHATLLNRAVMGDVVVDHEEVRRIFDEGPGKLQLIMIYEVRDGRIAKAWIITGAKTLD